MIIAIAIVIAFSTPASISASASGNESQQHTYIITFKPSAPGQKNDKGTDLAKAMDDEKIKKIKSIPGKLKYNYKIINAIAMDLPDSAVEALKSRDDIESILPDTTAYADLNEVPEHINATAAWNTAPGYNGAGINVSVLDSGVDIAHPDLQGKVLQWHDFLNARPTPYDDSGHGTYVAGIIAGTGSASSGLYKGVAYGANLFSAKVLDTSGTAYVSDIIAAIDWSVQNHADVISMSLSNPIHYQPVDDAVHNAVVNGVVVVCSAGNTGPYTGSIKCPSDSPDAITVGSTDIYDQLSSFSSRGPTWDGRTKPDLVAIGEGVVSARASGAIVGTPISQFYMYASGTSASCPQISAACAILLQANPGLSPVEVKNALLNTAHRLSAVCPNNNTGWGSPDVGAALNMVMGTQDKITVHVHNGTGTAIQGASVTAGSQTITTNASGNAQFMLDRGTSVNIHVTATDYEAYDTTYTPSGEATVDVTLTPMPIAANFSATPLQGNVPLDVQFTDTSTGTISSWSWNFGDGTSSTEQNPSHQYTSPGHYTVVLTVTGQGGQDSESKADYVYVTTPTPTPTPTPAPVADFTANPSSGDAPLTVEFTDASSGVITLYSWDFGDGGSTDVQSPTYEFSDAGTYTVTLTVTGPGGSDSESAMITVNVTSTPTPAPVADFTANPMSGTAPLTVQFTDASTGIILSRSWSFGDGGSSTDVSPSHIYSDAGTYTATLTVTGPGGNGSKPATITVTATPTPSAWKTYVANNGGNTVSVIDQRTNMVINTINTGAMPMGITYSPDGSLVYVAVESLNKVVVISTATDTIVGNIPVGKTPRGLAVSRDGSRLYVGNYGGGSVSIVNTTNPGNYTVIKTVTGVTKPHQLWIDPGGNRLYIGTYQSNNVYVINTTADNGTIVKTLSGNKPYFVSLDPSGNRLFVANYGANNIQVYDTNTLSLLNTFSTATGPLSPVVSPDGTRLYYVTDGNSNLVIADAASYATIKSVKCGSGVRGIACSPDGTKVYVTNMYSNSVSVVNVAGDNGGILATVPVGAYPYGLEQFAGFY